MAFQPSDGHVSKRSQTHLILSLPHALPTFSLYDNGKWPYRHSSTRFVETLSQQLLTHYFRQPFFYVVYKIKTNN